MFWVLLNLELFFCCVSHAVSVRRYIKGTGREHSRDTCSESLEKQPLKTKGPWLESQKSLA